MTTNDKTQFAYIRDLDKERKIKEKIRKRIWIKLVCFKCSVIRFRLKLECSAKFECLAKFKCWVRFEYRVIVVKCQVLLLKGREIKKN